MGIPGPWDLLDDIKYQDEAEIGRRLLDGADEFPFRAAALGEARALIEAARRAGKQIGIVQEMLQEFSLGSREGIALMCLAEALLRTPDPRTRDRLIAEQVDSADWSRHLGHSASLVVNASTWALMLTGKLIEPDPGALDNVPGFVRRLAVRMGEPLLRRAVAMCLRIMGEQFVLGRDIAAALQRAAAENLTCSFDMLGEGARTGADAQRHFDRYVKAIAAVGAATRGGGPCAAHGVSVKLSALSPRYEAVHEVQVWEQVYPRLLELAEVAAGFDLNLTIDAEEADRLTLSLRLLERLCGEPRLGGWTGLGLAVQAYQPRAVAVIDELAALAQRTGRRLMVRLVKGAYWDTEIKRAQVAGMPGYPVFTTKAATDVNYLVCARALIAAGPALYPQFATHNAHTLAALHEMAAGAGATVEFQRLHGMGGALYEAAAGRWGALNLRTYAPVGSHDELLPYLVRRLLENGANSSFVHRLLDPDIPPDEVAPDPWQQLAQQPGPSPAIPLPRNLYGPERRNSQGRDLSIRRVRETAEQHVAALRGGALTAGPIIGGELLDGAERAVRSPGDGRVILGTVREMSLAQLDQAVARARRAAPRWNKVGGAARAQVLRCTGDALETGMDRLVALLALEAGRTVDDAVAEVREAVDFCRYYARLAEQQFAVPIRLPGPVGEVNELELMGRGVAACISPWNFPLSIFTGQIAAALAAGNAVVAKPAEQTAL
ncbi:MAG TPA: bifunctional proline dehydrogenase/L-glutamate gamma-semialdehyde dehydrogenase PutA, partial [Novosphingobium sp.]